MLFVFIGEFIVEGCPEIDEPLVVDQLDVDVGTAGGGLRIRREGTTGNEHPYVSVLLEQAHKLTDILHAGLHEILPNI